MISDTPDQDEIDTFKDYLKIRSNRERAIFILAICKGPSVG